MPAITILIALIRLRSIDQPIVPIRLRSTDQIIVPVRLRSTNRMIVPVRLWSTDRLIDKLYAWPLLLPPLVPYYHPNCFHLQPNQYLTALLPCCLPTALQAWRKNYQCWNVWTGIYGQRLRGHVSLISHPYGDSSAPYSGTAILTILCFRHLLDKNQFIS